MFEGSRRYLEAVAAAGLAVAVVSSSANTREVLEVTGLDKFVQAAGRRSDDAAGETSRASLPLTRFCAPPSCSTSNPPTGGGLRGRAGRCRGRARRGHFGFVVGVDRVGQAEALRRQRRRRRRDRPRRIAAEPMITDDSLPRRAMARPRDQARISTCWPKPSRCSRCPTATSGCAATSTRASRTGCPGPTSTRSTRPGRCRTPKRDTAIRRTVNRSSTSPTARSCACSSTTSRSTSDTANCTSTNGFWTCAPAR